MQTNKLIDGGNPFDWGQASKDYAKYRDIYPQKFYDSILELGLCGKGQRVLDLGTGTGVLPRNLDKNGASFVGADISEDQIAEARRLSEGMEIEYIVSPAEQVNFPDSVFDAVTACQCFQYFDRTALLPNLHRMLKDGGHFCIMQMAWLPGDSEVAAESERLVLKYNPKWSGGKYSRSQPNPNPEWLGNLFRVSDIITYDLPVSFTRETWRGRILACRGIGASTLTADEINRFDGEHTAYLQTVPEHFDIPHYVTIYNLLRV
jgi:SAM-dependent methyltransferase